MHMFHRMQVLLDRERYGMVPGLVWLDPAAALARYVSA